MAGVSGSGRYSNCAECAALTAKTTLWRYEGVCGDSTTRLGRPRRGAKHPRPEQEQAQPVGGAGGPLLVVHRRCRLAARRVEAVHQQATTVGKVTASWTLPWRTRQGVRTADAGDEGDEGDSDDREVRNEAPQSMTEAAQVSVIA
jgi:hypothetical protein